MSFTPHTRIDLALFWSTIQRSAEIGKGREGGLARLALTDSDREVRDQFVEWCKAAALTVEIDQTGSPFGRRAGNDNNLPPIFIGSHLDTQINGAGGARHSNDREGRRFRALYPSGSSPDAALTEPVRCRLFSSGFAGILRPPAELARSMSPPER